MNIWVFKPGLKSALSDQGSWHWVLQTPPQTFFLSFKEASKRDFIMRFHGVNITFSQHLGTFVLLCSLELLALFWLSLGRLRCSFSVPCLFSTFRLQTHLKAEIYCTKTPARGWLRETMQGVSVHSACDTLTLIWNYSMCLFQPKSEA